MKWELIEKVSSCLGVSDWIATGEENGKTYTATVTIEDGERIAVRDVEEVPALLSDEELLGTSE